MVDDLFRNALLFAESKIMKLPGSTTLLPGRSVRKILGDLQPAGKSHTHVFVQLCLYLAGMDSFSFCFRSEGHNGIKLIRISKTMFPRNIDSAGLLK